MTFSNIIFFVPSVQRVRSYRRNSAAHTRRTRKNNTVSVRGVTRDRTATCLCRIRINVLGITYSERRQDGNDRVFAVHQYGYALRENKKRSRRDGRSAYTFLLPRVNNTWIQTDADTVRGFSECYTHAHVIDRIFVRLSDVVVRTDETEYEIDKSVCDAAVDARGYWTQRGIEHSPRRRSPVAS